MHYLLSLLFASFFILPMEAKGAVEVNQKSIKLDGQTVTFTQPKRGYSFQYPKDWANNDDVQGFDIFIMAPKTAEGTSVANLSIISGDLPKEVGLEAFYNANMKDLMDRNSSSIKMIDNGTTTVAGLPSKWMHYTRSDDETEIIHYFVVSDNVGYLITAGTAIGYFDQYKPSFEKMVKSFKRTKDEISR